ncbi:phage tail protein I [Vibrio diabolicus]|uniref:phage tail protein I n=1 Tax=Vibrio diabolicus TaxID=50719 RepID=UPI00211A6A7B|nr:phage tail protein I [Vibrio diabolicus]MCQ9065276.1 phage tail protein I [Vibrio diabolicus]
MSQSISESNTSNYSLLGDNASPLEIALERVLSNALNDICPPIPELRNANKTPEHLLPYLALDKQVPEWESSDSLEQKRKTVKNQRQIFKKGGTTSGIELAIEALGGITEFKRWYEYGGDPYAMKIISWDICSPSLKNIERVKSRIEDAKSLRDSFDVGQGFLTSGNCSVAGTVQFVTKISVKEL